MVMYLTNPFPIPGGHIPPTTSPCLHPTRGILQLSGAGPPCWVVSPVLRQILPSAFILGQPLLLFGKTEEDKVLLPLAQ